MEPSLSTLRVLLGAASEDFSFLTPYDSYIF